MGNALKAEDVSRFGGGVDTLQDARHGERLLRKNAGRSVVDNAGTPCVLPEQAFTVTRILEGIYTSAKPGDIFRF